MTAYKDENPNASYSDLSQAAFVLFGVPLSRSAAHQILKTRDIIEKVPKNHAHLVRRRLGFKYFEDLIRSQSRNSKIIFELYN